MSRKPDVVAAARFKCMQVVFLEQPSRANLGQLLNGTSSEPEQRPRFVVNRESKEVLSAKHNWRDYEHILMTHLFKQMDLRGKGKFGRTDSSGWSRDRKGNLEFETGVVTVASLGRRDLSIGECKITRILKLAMTKVEPEQNSTNAGSCLLVHFSLTHELKATKNIHELLNTTWRKTVRKVEVRSLGEPPIKTGLLCDANGTISDKRELGALEESLLDYNRRAGFKRRQLLQDADAETRAVGMEIKDIRGRTRVLPYPPQLLEPVFRKKDILSKDYATGTKCNATTWITEATKAANLLRSCQWPQNINIRFPGEFFKPKCQIALVPTLQNGPVLKDRLNLQLVFPKSLPREDKDKILTKIKTESSNSPFRDLMPTLQVSKLCEYDDKKFSGKFAGDIETNLEESFASLGTQKKEMIQPEKTIVIGIISGKKSDKEVTEYYSAIKKAARSRVGSQCVKFPTSTFAWRNIMTGILAKLGSQFKVGKSGSKSGDMSEKGTYHVSYDVARGQGVDYASCNIFGSDGIYLRSWEISQKGEMLSHKFMDSLATGLQHAKRKKGEEIFRVFVIRDGRFQANEIESLQCMLHERFNCSADFVEVTKSGADMVRMFNMCLFNRNKGMPTSGCYWKLRADTAVLCTTGSPDYTGQTGQSRYPV